LIDKKLLEILACPLSKAPLILDGERLVSTDAETRRVYRIDDGLPILLIEESEQLSPEDHAAILEKHGEQAFTKRKKAQK
jgi:uncharacterized protein YbaR (Trm112 family)